MQTAPDTFILREGWGLGWQKHHSEPAPLRRQGRRLIPIVGDDAGMLRKHQLLRRLSSWQGLKKSHTVKGLNLGLCMHCTHNNYGQEKAAVQSGHATSSSSESAAPRNSPLKRRFKEQPALWGGALYKAALSSSGSAVAQVLLAHLRSYCQRPQQHQRCVAVKWRIWNSE